MAGERGAGNVVLGVLAVVVSVAVLGGALYSFSLSEGNVRLQQRVAERQNTINGGLQLSRFNNQLIKALAGIAAQTGDDDIREMLAGQGITYEVNLTQDAPAEGGAVDEVD